MVTLHRNHYTLYADYSYPSIYTLHVPINLLRTEKWRAGLRPNNNTTNQNSVRRAVGRNNNHNELEAQIRLSLWLFGWRCWPACRVIRLLISSFPLLLLAPPAAPTRRRVVLLLSLACSHPVRLLPEFAPPRKSDAALERLHLVHRASGSTVDESVSVSRLSSLKPERFPPLSHPPFSYIFCCPAPFRLAS
ncbi:hypothetical protein BO70DRAFT_20384 [Aspergillus heteromorphus CBS 117.55]|uniref:Uncharacterized protein n=1 Tax=Aspergillus heteromorphus CBS 117.55 TaxID=1448321 RepID=A0A317X5M2_9EURO|nr:uncharacterized protein BO70DRAFT_20384 [Aspergillus heteromorphus CBS 117.55]PWY92847.1 hypothetical protein BO70DRAFT_20384 [Aspergillus heteromorphus CBS 117.55]